MSFQMCVFTKFVAEFLLFSRRPRFSSITLILLMFVGCYAFFTEECPPTRCEDFNPFEQWLSPKDAPNLHMLQLHCPKTIQVVDCRLKEIDTCLGGKLLHLAFSPNRSLASFSKVVFVTVNLIREMCDQSSVFRREYGESIDCYKTFYPFISEFCDREVREIESQFVDTLDLSQEDDIACKMGLFSGPYLIECTSKFVGSACGEKAKSLYRKLLFMFKDTYFIKCPGFNKKWREEYMDFLLNYTRNRSYETYDAFFGNLGTQQNWTHITV